MGLYLVQTLNNFYVKTMPSNVFTFVFGNAVVFDNAVKSLAPRLKTQAKTWLRIEQRANLY